MFSWRSYEDPDFLLPEEYDKIRWEKMIKENKEKKAKEAAEKAASAAAAAAEA